MTCKTCNDTKEVDSMEEVYMGERGHLAPIGTVECPDCKIIKEEIEE